MNLPKTVLICQGRSCQKYGSKKILEVFQTNLNPNFELIASGCLGQCGNGPMVLILPEKIFYSHVTPNKVSLIING